MKRYWLAAPLVAVLLLATPVTAQLAPQPSRLDLIMAAKKLRVGTTGDYLPFTWWNEEKKAFEGIDIDMARSLAQGLGVELEIVKTSWPTLMTDFEADKFDIAMGGVSVSLDRQRKGYFSQPYLRDGKAAITRCEDVAKYSGLALIDRPETRMVVNPGGTNERFARATIKQAPIRVHPDNRTIWKEILENRADVMITDAVETRYWQKAHKGLCPVNADKPFNFSEKAYFMPRDIALKQFVDQWLRQATETGEFAAIARQWIE